MVFLSVAQHLINFLKMTFALQIKTSTLASRQNLFLRLENNDASTGVPCGICLNSTCLNNLMLYGIQNMPSLYIDPLDKGIGTKLRNLEPTRGYCVFVDIVGSTKLKDSSLERWVLLIHNTFANIKSHLSSSWPPMKCIGDALMFFIPDNPIDNYETSLHLFANLYSIVTNNKSKWLRRIKVSVVRCMNSYAISFIKNAEDVYGKDIDLAARLLELAGENEIILNDIFYNKLLNAYNRLNPRHKHPFKPLIHKLVGPWFVNLKGFKEPTCIYKLPNLSAHLVEKSDVY